MDRDLTFTFVMIAAGMTVAIIAALILFDFEMLPTTPHHRRTLPHIE